MCTSRYIYAQLCMGLFATLHAAAFTRTQSQRDSVDARQRRLYRSVAMVPARSDDIARSYIHRANAIVDGILNNGGERKQSEAFFHFKIYA